MKINEVQLKNFGKYKDAEPLLFKEGLNIVYGFNEAGKTTLFNSVLTLLYGFKPANREAHPYLGWHENKIELTGIFEDEEGLFSVERKLMSSPIGRVSRDSQEKKINNRPLDNVQSISKESYASIYALTLHDLIKMSETPWSEIEDRLILNYGVEDIKSPRSVLLELDEEMKKLYNPRGQAKHTRVKIIEKEIKALKVQKNDILTNQQNVLEKEEYLKTLDGQLTTLRKEQMALSSKVAWWEKHGQVIDLLKQLEGLRQEDKRLQGILGTLPENVRGFRQLEEEVFTLETGHGQLEKEKTHIDEKVTPLTDREQGCIEKIEILKQLLKDHQNTRHEDSLYEQQAHFVQDKRSQLERHLGDIVRPLPLETIGELAEVNFLSVEGKIEEIQRLSKDSEALQKELYTLYQQPPSKNRFMAVGLIIAGAGLFGLGLYLGQEIMNYIAVILLSYGGFKAFNTGAFSQSEDQKVFEGKIQFNSNKIDGRVKEIQELLSFTFLDKKLILESSQRLYQLLLQGKDMARELMTAMEALAHKEKALTTEKQRIASSVYEIFGEDLEWSSIETLLDTAQKKQQHNRDLLKESGLYDQQLQDLSKGMKVKKEALVLLKTYLLEVGDGNVEDGLALIATYKRNKETVRVVEEQLQEKDPGHVMQGEIQQEGETIEESHYNDWKVALSDVNESIEQLRLERQKCQSELNHLMASVENFEVESALLDAEERLAEAKEAYDQLQLLRAVVAGYDQEYREQHQPHIHRRTGDYFKRISNGKYSKVFNDELQGKTTLVVRHKDEDRAVDNDLSQGTRDQLYLALRLALADELDKDKSKLPIFLDELFVNWDISRLEEGIGLLETLSKDRQIILFTCHQWLVEKCQSITPCHLVMLEN